MLSNILIAIHEAAQAVHFMHLSLIAACLIMLWAIGTLNLKGGVK